MLVVSWFIGCFICLTTYCCIFNEYINNKKFNINYRIILFSIFNGIIYYIITKYNFLFIRLYAMNILLFVELLIVYKNSFLKSLINFTIIFILTCLAELLFGFLLIFILKLNIQSFISFWYGDLFSNLSIYFITILLSKIKFIKKFTANIVDWCNINKHKIHIIYVLLMIFITIIFLYNNYIEKLPKTILLFANLISVVIIYFIVNYFSEKINNNRIIREYDQLLGYVKKYEKVVADKSKKQHEYKNQLVLLKGLIVESDKKAIEYIDNLFYEFSDDNNVELLKKIQLLPNGGLRGLIYYKIEEMYEKGINVFVDISPELEYINLDDAINKNLNEISKIIGVYIDNAIEAAINSKEKYIVLNIYIDNNNWVFSLSNTYSSKFDISKVDLEGYTTKEDGKGYGLSLVKDIIDNNANLRQEKELNGIYYVQKLYIKK